MKIHASKINVNTHSGPSFDLKNRIERTLWGFVYWTLFRWSPRCMHSWRSFLLRLFGAHIASGCHIYPDARIWLPKNLVCIEECCIGEGAVVLNYALVSIGKQTVISQEVWLCTGTHDYTKKGFPLISKPIIIGDFAWIGAQCFVHPGKTIANGCVVGARSVVTRNLSEWTVYAGNPCKPIKPRLQIRNF
jgi:putative colanic acid biosynthesis acetyltransferase WcaF